MTARELATLVADGPSAAWLAAGTHAEKIATLDGAAGNDDVMRGAAP